MTTWVATCHGALDLRKHELAEQGLELLVCPTAPSEPIYLWGQGAEVWRALTESPIDDSEIDWDKRGVLRELERMSLASSVQSKTHGVSEITTPWLGSPQHEMVYALLVRVAASLGIDIVFIKGPTLHAQGLREREHSGDVDCWVRPGADVRLAEAMRVWGWTPVYSAFTGTAVSHSLTLNPGSWGCAIDVHSRFPGMNIAPEHAFELVQKSSEIRTFASTDVHVPSKEVHAVIAALHDLRPVAGILPRSDQQAAAEHALRAAGTSVVPVVDRFEAGFVLQDALNAAFPAVSFDLGGLEEPSDWGWRATSSSPRRYFKAWLAVPLRQKPRVLLRLLWPTPEMMRAGQAASQPRASSLSMASSRVRRAVSALVRLGRSR